MHGPSAMSKENVLELLESQKTAALKVGKLMDRMFLTFKRNRLRGRQAKQYNSTAFEVVNSGISGPGSGAGSFPSEWERKSAGSNSGRPGMSGMSGRVMTISDLRPLQEERFLGYGDRSTYKSSSEEDKESDWDREEINESGKFNKRNRNKPESKRLLRRPNENASTHASASSRRNRLLRRTERIRETEMEMEIEDSDESSADTDEENIIDMFGSDDDEKAIRQKRIKKQVSRSQRVKKTTYKISDEILDLDTEFDTRTYVPTKPKISISRNLPGSRWVVPTGTPIDRDWVLGEEQYSHQYCPQMGDRVVYFPQGHSSLLSEFPSRGRLPPWNSFTGRYPIVECEVRSLSYDFPPTAELRRCKSVVASITLVILRVPDKWKLHQNTGLLQVDLAVARTSRHKDKVEHSFTVDIRNWDDAPDFLVPYHTFAKAMKSPWRAGMEVTADYKATEQEEEASGSNMTRYRGRIVVLSESSPDWPQSPWEALEVLWDTGELQRLGPWEATLIVDPNSSLHQQLNHPSFSPPTIDRNEAIRIEREIGVLMNDRQEDFSPFEFSVDPIVFSSYYSIVSTAFNLSVIASHFIQDICQLYTSYHGLRSFLILFRFDFFVCLSVCLVIYLSIHSFIYFAIYLIIHICCCFLFYLSLMTFK